MRICSFLPSATEIAFALGLGDEIVGVTHECDYPPEARSKPIVVETALDAARTSRQIDHTVRQHWRAKTSLYTIDLCRLREAKPDIILTQALCDVCALNFDDVVQAAQALEPPPKIVSLNPRLLADVLADIRQVGAVTGKIPEAEALVLSLQGRMDRVRTAALVSSQRPRVMCLEWLDPLFSAGHWVPEMVDLAGGTNGLAKKGDVSAQIQWDQVVQLNPEILILMPCGFDVQRTQEEAAVLCHLPGWSELPAVRNKHVFAVNGAAYFNRSGPRLIEGLEILSSIIHPEIFPRELAPEAARRIGA
jgi:iron complex transport system substrate-binding protein